MEGRLSAKFGIAVAVALLWAGSAYANCIGTGTLKTCYDNSGNSYTVTKMGNTTTVTGSGNGSTWSQTSSTYGNTTYTNGQSNGRPWNETQQSFGGQTSVTGTNSQGQPYSYSCNQYGCQ
jgi:hypothetical protein